jgi:hypothetical protein
MGGAGCERLPYELGEDEDATDSPGGPDAPRASEHQEQRGAQRQDDGGPQPADLGPFGIPSHLFPHVAPARGRDVGELGEGLDGVLEVEPVHARIVPIAAIRVVAFSSEPGVGGEVG